MDNEQQERLDREAKLIAGAVKTLQSIERNIKPLRFEPVNQGEEDNYNRHSRLTRNVITADGEIVGQVQTLGTYGWKGISYRLSSPRIPIRGRSWNSHYRDYKKLDSLAASILKFCMPVSNDERRAKVLREEIRYYEGRQKDSWKRTQGPLAWRKPWRVDEVEVADYHQPRFDIVIAGLAERDPETEALLRTLVNKRRVYERFTTFIDDLYLNKRRGELEGLHLDNETVRK